MPPTILRDLTLVLLFATLAASTAMATPSLAAQASTEAAPRAERTDTWPSWRGPLGTGVAPNASPPLHWSETRNVRWKAELPGAGHASPVVWHERVYVTTAVPYGDPVPPHGDDAPGAHDNVQVTRRHRFVVLALDRRDGSVLWARTVHEGLPAEGGHASGTYASASPVTDGERVFASFGSQGVYALSSEGELLWGRDLGPLRTKHGHGEGSSPALLGDTLVVNQDHEGESFVVALDAESGAERWRRGRDEPTSWTSPIVVRVDGRAQAIVSGTERIRGYALDTGEVLWRCAGLSHNVVATPVFADGILWAASSYEKQALVALDLRGAKGELTDSEHVLWYRRKGTPYVPSPLLYDDALYVLHHYQGIVSRLDALTGEEPSRPLRLDGIRDVYASPVGADGRIWVVDRSGWTAVIEHAAEPRELARNRLDDRFSATPALVADELFLRGERYLYCLGQTH